MNLETLFIRNIEQHFPGAQHGKVLLAVSGGPDSIALLHLFSTLNRQIAVAHCNFGLRGQESNLDEHHVQNVCLQLDIPFFVKRFDTFNYKKERSVSTQVAARELRYAWFLELCEKYEFQFIATAHHQDDNVETVLQNMLRGTGIRGLSGIPLQNGPIIRPLLFATKSQLIQYLSLHSHAYRTDASNSENKYTRNVIRNTILPQLSAINANAGEHINNLSGHARFASVIIREKLASLISRFVKKNADSIQISYGTISTFEFAPFYLFELITDYGFNTSQCFSIHEAFLQGKTGSRFLTGGWELIIDRKELIIIPFEAVPGHTDICFEIIPSTPLQIGNLNYHFELLNARDLQEYLPDHLYINADILSFPLRIRSWKEGDSFRPLGSPGSKKVSDFLIDAKVSLTDKKRVCLLENSSGQPVALFDYRIDHRFRVLPATQAVLHIYQQKEESN